MSVRPPPVGTIQNLLERMNSSDKDFRFMATNDLISELQKHYENIRWDDDIETKTTYAVLNLLKDKNGEVQNIAVKCLGFLVGRIKDDRRQLVIKSLCQMLKNEREQIRDITSIALKTIVTEIPINKKMIEIINNDLNPNLLAAIGNSKDFNVQLESLDILTELINRIGSHLSSFHPLMQQELIRQLESERSAVRKRSMNALSYLLACCSDELFIATKSQLLQALVELAPQTEAEAEARFTSESSVCTSCKTLLQCIATIIRMAGHRSKVEQLNQIMPVIHSFCQINDDELREHCLQLFEAYVKRCPVDVSAALPEIIKICLVNIYHDPNYNYDEDVVDESIMEMDAPDDEDSESAEDYSDDDDLSWKVRRASAKCLEAIITVRKDLVNEFFVTIAPTILSRFKEREESVKADIIQTFVTLLDQTRKLINESKGAQQAPAVLKLREMIPTIAGRASALLREKGVKTRQIVFQMFTQIMNIIPNALSEHIVSLMPGILYSLSDKGSTSNMKIDALVFLRELIKTHPPQTFYPYINVILPPVMMAVSDSFYKIASEALALLTELVCVIRPANHEPMPGYESVMSTIYEKTSEIMSKTEVDLEIKQRAISCMGTIIATFGDKMELQLPVASSSLLDKLANETTRLTCVKALIKIANSPVDLSMSSIFAKALNVLGPFLRKNSRPLRINTLILIENIVKRSPGLINIESLQSSIIINVPALICESDLYISQLALTLLTTLIQSSESAQRVLSDQAITETLKLVRSPLLQGSALQALLKFFATLGEGTCPGLDHSKLVIRLLEPIYTGTPVHKQAYYSTAKSIAAVSVTDPKRALLTVHQLVSDSQQHLSNDNIYSLILLSIGEIGRVTDLGDVPQLLDVILHAFNSNSEDVKTSGSYALGCVAVGSMDKFLPIILHEIETRNRRQYLILHSLREVISGGHLKDTNSVWQLLMKHCESPEEGTRNVVSECLGRLCLLEPMNLLQRLINSLRKEFADKPLGRSTIVAAIKFTISDQPQEIDDLLRQCIGEFLSSLQDEDINVRRVALITFNSAAHNKPSLIVDLLPEVLPLLYKETLIKPELIRQVEMGPFKHKVDDGLDSRKAAFECMYTLLDTCQNQLDIFEFLTHVENGLMDHYDIKMLTYLMLSKLATLCPSAVLQRMDRLVYCIQDVCRTELKENAVKQEHEKLLELKRSALRAFDALKAIPDAERHPVLNKFYDDLVQNDKGLVDLYNSIHRDSVSSNDFSQNME